MSHRAPNGAPCAFGGLGYKHPAPSGALKPLVPTEPQTPGSYENYSYLSALSGFTREARRAGR